MNLTKTLHEEVNRLLRLKSDNVKNALSNVDDEVAMTWLSELFKGNGWTVAFHTGARNHRSLLISDPKRPDTVLFIVKFIISNRPLTRDRVKDELTDFENNIGPAYDCGQFCIIATHGYEAKAQKLEDYLLLEDWTYIENLIADYSRDKKQEPRIQLFAHNEKTYKKVKKMMGDAKGVAVVQATGTGKSYLIAKLLQDFAGEKRLVMAPSYYIIDQIKEHIRWETDLPGEANKIDPVGSKSYGIEFMTYARSMNLTAAEINGLKPKMIVLDEFHRCGAEEWGRGVQDILNAYPQTFKFGTSATPIRYLDNGRDMSMELFQGHVAEKLNLAQAIVRNILPMPKYVCALYTLSEEITSMRAKIAGSRKNEETKRKLLLDLDAIHIDWERSRGIPHVLKKHLRTSTGSARARKFIIFCKDEAHLNEMEPIVKKWFKEALDDIAVKSYIVHSKEAQSDEQLEAFKNETSKDELHLLFSIDMLNEGLHVNEVSGVVLLRPTESPNIFYQQIGRCLKVGLSHQPVIFDFVNNFKAIGTHDFLYDLDFARKELLDRRTEEGLEDRCPRFDVNDEVREITEVFGEIEFKLEFWEEMYERLVAYKKRFGNTTVPDQWPEDPPLAKWLARQRKRHYFNKLDEEQKHKLHELGVKFSYKPPDAPVEWQQRFDELHEYKNQNGHLEVTPSENKKLNIWLHRQRNKYKKGLLLSERIKKLNSIGFVWDTGNTKFFEKKFIAMQKFKHEHGHLKFSIKHPLTAWQTNLRKLHKEGKLTQQQQDRLTELGFDFVFRTNHSLIREKRLQELESFYNKHGHMEVPRENKNYEALAKWLEGIRKPGHRRSFSPGDLARFSAMGMEWERKFKEKKWNKMYDQLLLHYSKTGSAFIERSDSSKKLLKSWCTQQRTYKTEGRLTPEREKKLNEIGFVWDHMDAAWDLRFNELNKFKKLHGHCDVTAKYSKDYTKLLEWLKNQKTAYLSGKLSPERYKKLTGVGINFGALESVSAQRDKHFEELEKFYKIYKHSEVTAEHKDYPRLYKWLNYLRKRRKKGELSKEMIAQLDKMKMNWDSNNYFNHIWFDNYQKLVDYRKKTGTLFIAEDDKANRSLKFWCNNQKKNRKKGTMPKERIDLLNKIGFTW